MAHTLEQLRRGFRLGEILVEPAQNRITRGGATARVEPRVMDVLVCLAEHAGEVVSRDTLNARVWAQVVVTDQAVTNCISELRHHLGDDRAAHRLIETFPKRGYRLTVPVELVPGAHAASTAADAPTAAQTAAVSPVASPRATRPGWRMLIFGLVIVASLATFAWWHVVGKAPALTSVAIVRFENAAGEEGLDYLSLALPDEIATLLTRSRELAVRPLSYVDARDPVRSARARGVDHVVTGRFYREDDGELSLAIEAQHVVQERVVWRTRLSVPHEDLLVMRGRLEESLRGGLVPALGVAVGDTPESAPENAEAYQLYLRSLALPQQPGPTERAIALLEEAVARMPRFAPAWHALGNRYYDHATWWRVGEPGRQRSLDAHRRALELDPDYLAAARALVTRHAESGDLAGAWRAAGRLMERFGESASTHFALAYVLRYGGMLDAAQRHCEQARAHDAHDPRLRSCGYAFLHAGELDSVMRYFALDEGAYFVQWATVLHHLRSSARDAALEITRQAAAEPTRALMEPCLEGANGAALDAPVAAFVEHWQRSADPEAHYAIAPMLSFCGRPQEALRFLARAVELGYCAFPALDLDPVWASLRDDPEFRRIRTDAMACHDRFRWMIDSQGGEP